MKQITQFRYYGENRVENTENTTKKLLTTGNIFNGYNISQLGIQARPGTKFWLNNSRYAIWVGDTGIYELDLQNSGYIYQIRFDSDSINVYDAVGNTDRLLIDIVYES